MSRRATIPAAWFHSSPAWLGFRETGAAAARPQYAADEGLFYEEEKRGSAAGGVAAGGAEEGLEVAKLGISPKIVSQLASRGITKLFPIQVSGAGSSPHLLFHFQLNREQFVH